MATISGVGPAEFLRRLVHNGEVPQVRLPLTRSAFEEGEEPARVKWVEDFVPKAAQEWLVRNGGFRVRAVGGADERSKRKEARIWDPFPWDRIGFKFGPGTLRLAWALAEWASKIEGGALPKVTEKMFDGIEVSEAGDIVIFHLMLEPIVERLLGTSVAVAATTRGADDADEEPDEEEEPEAKPAKSKRARKAKGRSVAPEDEALAQVRIILDVSPLTALIHAEDADMGAASASPDKQAWAAALKAAAKRLSPLLEGDRAYLLTYLDDLVARAWIDREEQRRADPPAESRRRYLALAAAIQAFCAAAAKAERPDALRPVIRFFERYLVRFGPQRQDVTKPFLDRKDEFQKLSERDAYCKDVSTLFGALRCLEDLVEEIQDIPSIERTGAQAVFNADFRERLWSGRDGDGPTLADEIAAIRRELSQEVG